MLVMISCAKTMREDAGNGNFPKSTQPQFMAEACNNAAQLAELSVDELSDILHVNNNIAADNKLRYLEFSVPGKNGMPALLSYDGIVFKRIAPENFSAEDLAYAQRHLLITSFLYGLLRPMDEILPYRLEGNVKLPDNGGMTMFEYWRGKLTDILIDRVNESGGTLCNLASSEMKNLFDWRRVAKSVRIITPEFKVEKNGKMRTIVIYAKMMRGEMTRFILRNRISDPEQLKEFTSEEGFAYNRLLSSESTPVFTL